jgi:ATP-dependent helicase/nuclease subunit A
LTAEQARALEVDGSSVALGAGAGCGKTLVLARRFVAELEGDNPRPLGRIVALTFTNKAARELRGRIRLHCRLRLDAGADPARWRGVLRQLDAARIGTFHSFCGKVLRAHALEAGIDPGFVVFDEPIALSLRESALDTALRDRLENRDPDAIELAVAYGLTAVRDSLHDLLGNRVAGESRPWLGKSPEDLVKIWKTLFDETVFPAMIRELVKDVRATLSLLDAPDVTDPKVRARASEIAEATAALEAIPAVESLETLKSLAYIKSLPRKLWPDEELYQAIKDQFDSIRKRCAELQDASRWDRHLALEAASTGLRFVRLAEHARAAYDQAKQARAGLDNDDLLQLTRDLLANVPEVRDRLAGSIDRILVDEFQDSDPIQAEILELLSGTEATTGKLFLVGDTKQSIYRFRGARPELFDAYREQFPSEGRLNLTENFRSSPAILAFVNALFGDTLTNAETALRAGGVAAEGSLDPAVLFLWPEVADEAGPARTTAGTARLGEAERVARLLRERLDAGWRIRDRGTGRLRPANAGDVAILFRSLADSAAYERALAAEGFDYLVVGGSGFFAQQEVLDLINLLTAVEDPLDGVALAGALRSPFFNLSDDALLRLAIEGRGSLSDGLDSAVETGLERIPPRDRDRVVRARSLLVAWREAKDRLPIAGLVERILDESGYEASLLGEFLGDRKRANARKLVRMARRFDEQGGFTLADFVARLRADLRAATKETQAATTDEGGEIIRLMSIHQAKGLEFPVVVLPDLDRKRPNDSRRLAFDPILGPVVGAVESEASDDSEKPLGAIVHRHRESEAEDAEALRLLYVATTRARDRLILSSGLDPTSEPNSPALQLLARRFDRPTGRFLGEPLARQPEPRVEVVAAVERSAPPRASSRAWPPLLEIARVIRQAAGVDDSA